MKEELIKTLVATLSDIRHHIYCGEKEKVESGLITLENGLKLLEQIDI